MAKYKAYPEYKDSGVEWLNSTPAHWSKAPIKYLALAASPVFLDGDWIESKDLSDDGVRYITTGNIGEGFYKEQGSGFITEKTFNKLDCTEILEGDILISRLNKPIGRACLVSELNFKTVTSVDNVIFRTDEPYNKKYLVYLFSSNYYFQHTGNLARGTTMQRISRGLLGNIRVPVPLLSEQVIITAFLDHETTKIDNLMEKQQQLIELLKEKRQAVISHAVTKGLNPDVPMKNSGVEWSGDVPSHWLKTIIKHIAKINPLKTKIAPDIMKKECSFIPMENLKLNKIILDEHRVIRDVYNSYTYFEDKDILMAKVTPCFENKNIAIANNLLNGVGFGTTEIYVIRCNNKINNEYLFYRLQEDNFSAIAEGSMTGAGGLKRVPYEVVNSFQFYLPTIYEQNEIASFLNSATTKIDTLIQKQLQQIDLLKERRTALISAAVTGKIDLRDWTPPASSTEASLTAEEATA